MNIKGLVVTVALLAILSTAAYVLNRPAPPPSSDPRVGQPVAEAATVEKAAKLKLVSEGKTVQLTRQTDGSWAVNSYHDLPADFSKLSGFVGDLTRAKIQRLVTSNPEKITRLEFKDTQIGLLDATDKPLWTVSLGKNFPSGGRFLRYGDEQKAYLADLSAWIDTEPRNWADSALLAVKSDEIARIEISFPDGEPVVVTRPKKEEPFTADNPPAGQKLKTDKLTPLLGSLTALRFSETSAVDDGNAVAARSHARTIKLTTFDGKTIAVALGRKPEKKITKPAPAPTSPDTPAGEASKPAEAVTETIPAGPVYAFITHSDAAAPINAHMQKRAFQVYEHTFTSLPAKRDELFEPIPPPSPASSAAEQAEKNPVTKTSN